MVKYCFNLKLKKVQEYHSEVGGYRCLAENIIF